MHNDQKSKSTLSQTAVEALTQRFFPSILKRLNDEGSDRGLLLDCVICIGELTLNEFPMIPMAAAVLADESCVLPNEPVKKIGIPASDQLVNETTV